MNTTDITTNLNPKTLYFECKFGRPFDSVVQITFTDNTSIVHFLDDDGACYIKILGTQLHRSYAKTRCYIDGGNVRDMYISFYRDINEHISFKYCILPDEGVCRVFPLSDRYKVKEISTFSKEEAKKLNLI